MPSETVLFAQKHMRKRLLLRLVCTALATLLLQPTLAASQARPAGQTPPPNSVEASLWALSDKAEIEAKRAGQLIKDEKLNAYINQVRCKIANDYCKDLRVYLMARPAFNASMAPNGYMEVWSGLLLRAETEAQLAFVLAHETAHFQESHSIEAWRNLRSKANWALGLSMVAGAAGAPSYVGDLIYLGTIASVFGFSRENETQADVIGFERAVNAGYDPKDAPAIWRSLIAEAAASDFDAVRKREARSGIFNTHPVSTERAAKLDALTKAIAANAPPNAAPAASSEDPRVAYRNQIRPFLSTWLRDELRRRDYGQTQLLLTRLKSQGADMGVLTFFEGELLRLRRKPGDLEAAQKAYTQAITHADAPADAWRELADAYVRTGEKAKAQEALTLYLTKAPEAPDKELVMSRIERLKAGS
jgi:predicted Zn-dependent protease